MTDNTRKPTIPADAVTKAMTDLFPADTASWTSRLFGMQKRSIERMQDGYSSMPPRIHDKIVAQTSLRDQMIAEINAAIARAEAAGGHPIVLRYALVDLLKGGRFDGDSEPL